MSLGATFAPLGGTEIVAHYGDPEGEVPGARSVVVDRSYLGVVAVRGKDRSSFLNGLLTNDVKSLGPGRGHYAATLDRTSHIIGDLRLLAMENEHVMLLEAETKEKLPCYLRKFVIREDVIFEPLASARVLGLYGPRSREIIEAATGHGPPSAPHNHVSTSIGGETCIVVNAPMTGGEGFEIMCEAAEVGQSWQRSLACGEGLLESVGAEAFDIMRFESGWLRYGVDIDETILLLEACLTDVVSFEKRSQSRANEKVGLGLGAFLFRIPQQGCSRGSGRDRRIRGERSCSSPVFS